MIVGLVGEAVVIAEVFRLLIPPLFLSPDNSKVVCVIAGMNEVFISGDANALITRQPSQTRPTLTKETHQQSTLTES